MTDKFLVAEKESKLHGQVVELIRHPKLDIGEKQAFMDDEGKNLFYFAGNIFETELFPVERMQVLEQSIRSIKEDAEWLLEKIKDLKEQ